MLWSVSLFCLFFVAFYALKLPVNPLQYQQVLQFFTAKYPKTQQMAVHILENSQIRRRLFKAFERLSI